MKSKIVAVSFILVIAVLGAFLVISRNVSRYEKRGSNQAKIVNPKYASSSQNENHESEDALGNETFTSFITLSSSETLISTLIFDFDNDAYDDQIVIVRKADSPFLHIVAGLYEPETKKYERAADIPTKISKTGTFSYSALDVIGNHTQALVYQGFEDSGDYVMNIFLCKKSGSLVDIVNIGSFSSDGTVFIQQTERPESYELAISNGESYSVWVYSSDKTEGEGEKPASQGLNQIQTEYRWNSSTGRYEFNRTTTVTASRLAARELSRIQDGTVETFAGFMDGLWYKTSNNDNTIRYLYFNYDAREIIFLNGDTEEVYNWEESKLRHNGIYLATTNSIISSLHRRFDIMLTGIDEIRVTVRDDVHMVIAESSLWDGQYKKTGASYNFNHSSAKSGTDSFAKKVTGGIWKTSDDTASLAFNGFSYSANTGMETEQGIFSIFSVGDTIVLQMRPVEGFSEMGSEYSLSFGTKVVTETVKNGKKTKTVEKTVVDEDNLILTPVKITPKDCFATEGRVWQLTRAQNL